MKMENDLGRDDIRLLVMRIALPSMLAQFVSVLYSCLLYTSKRYDCGAFSQHDNCTPDAALLLSLIHIFAGTGEDIIYLICRYSVQSAAE